MLDYLGLVVGVVCLVSLGFVYLLLGLGGFIFGCCYLGLGVVSLGVWGLGFWGCCLFFWWFCCWVLGDLGVIWGVIWGW